MQGQPFLLQEMESKGAVYKRLLQKNTDYVLQEILRLLQAIRFVLKC